MTAQPFTFIPITVCTLAEKLKSRAKEGKKPTQTKPAVKWHGVIEKQVCSLPPEEGEVRSLTCAGHHLLPGAAPWAKGSTAHISREGKGTGVGNRSLHTSCEQKGQPHLTGQLLPAHWAQNFMWGEAFLTTRTLRSYLWMSPVASGVSGAASCWEESNYTCDSDRARVQRHTKKIWSPSKYFVS